MSETATQKPAQKPDLTAEQLHIQLQQVKREISSLQDQFQLLFPENYMPSKPQFYLFLKKYPIRLVKEGLDAAGYWYNKTQLKSQLELEGSEPEDSDLDSSRRELGKQDILKYVWGAMRRMQDRGE